MTCDLNITIGVLFRQIFIFLAFCPTACVANGLGQANVKPSIYETAREWKTKTGGTINGVVVSIDKDNVVFRGTNDNQSTIPISNLISAQEAVVRVAYFGEQDKAQLERSQTLLGQIAETPNDVVDQLKSHHLGFTDSPYAGIWAAVCLSAGSNKYPEAMSLLRQSIERIDRQREFDASRHTKTLATALNNLAICMIKAHKADAAAGLLSRGLQLVPDAPILNANARQLAELGSNEGSVVELSDTSARRLAQASIGDDPTTVRISGWNYALDVELPLFELGAQEFVVLDPPRPGIRSRKLVTGIAVSPTLVIASGIGLGLRDENDRPLLTVSSFPATGFKTSESQIVLFDAESGLVALRVLDSPLPHVALGEAPDKRSEDAAVLSYPNEKKLPGSSLESSVGKVTEGPSSGSSLKIVGVKPLNGIAVSRQAEVMGVTYSEGATAVTMLTSPTQFYAFLRSATGPPKQPVTPASFAAIRSACVAVISWDSASSNNPSPTSPVNLSQLTTNLPELRVVDPWCVACQGVGFIDCQYGNCNKGVITVQKRVQVGFNTLTNTPIMGNKSFAQSCPHCGGRGSFSCRHCNNGRIR